MIWDHYEFRILGVFLSALINGDETGLSDDEARLFKEWTETQQANVIRWGWTVGHWTTVDDSGEEFARCEVTQLHGATEKVQLHVFKKEVA